MNEMPEPPAAAEGSDGGAGSAGATGADGADGAAGSGEPAVNAATALARSVLRDLVAHGVVEIVVAPGSRNAPLSFAALATARAGLVRLHTRIDERSAGFLALGLSKAGRRAAVICTSGTAVANLHPAALEAAHAGVSLVLVTADRPARLRGTDANQTTDQVGVFGPLVTTVDLASPLGDGDSPFAEPGVTHVNVQLDDPLLPPPSGPEARLPPHEATPEAPRDWTRTLRSGPAPTLLEPMLRQSLPRGPRTVVVAGDDAHQPARRLAEEAGWPLLAEPSSGSRTGDAALRCYRLLLAGELGERVERVVVFGHPTLSRPVLRLLSRPDVEVHAHRGAGVWSQRPYPVRPFAGRLSVTDAPAGPGGPTGPTGPDESDRPGDAGARALAADVRWAAEWREADRSVSRALDRLLAAEPDLTPYAVAGAVHAALAPGGLLVVGPSSPVRDLDLMARPTPPGERRLVLANRGLAGIDGVVSTAIGAALARQFDPVGRGHRRLDTRACALVGDVTFLHDMGALVRGPGQPEPDLSIVVVNDDGGSIFAMLEQGAPAYAGEFETLFGTPHGVDLAALCAATRTAYLRVESRLELDRALASPNGGVEVIEVRVRRDNRRELDERIRALRA